MAEEGHLRILAEDVTGVTKIYAVSPEGDQFELGGIREANINLNLEPSTFKTLNLEIIVESADIVTLHRPGMK
jgi:hypothetical protein